jgi:acyl-CoA reductase-like NAD-dependent aldehyde dehydrogenase
MARLSITKTPKCYVGGAFVRSESGRVFPLHDREGRFLANIPQCTRKDVRNAVEAAAKAGSAWAKRSGYNRGQILYRLAEMMEARGEELAAGVDDSSPELARQEVRTAIDRIVYYAGWTDKYEQVLGSVNPVASSHFNFTVTEPVGVVGVIAPDASPLLALISLVLPMIVSGNAVVALASSARPYPSIVLGEILATSDLPGGVVNLLTGIRSELIPTFATHAHIRVVNGVVNAEERELLRLGAAESVKRVYLEPAEETMNWKSERWQSVETIRAGIEFKTVWHPIGA